MMPDSNLEQEINSLLDDVEQLVEHTRELETELKKWKKKAESSIIERDQLKRENEQLEQTLQQQRLNFSEVMGKVENKLKAIREEAQNLNPEETSP
ncbi:MAG: hypothetical protein ABEJ65_07385 [bacterium]